MKQVAPGIHAWSVFDTEKGIDFNGHYVANEEGRVLVDPPAMDEATLAAIETMGAPSAIVVTNAHHSRASMFCAARWKIPMLAPEKDAALLPAAARLGGIHREGDRLAGGLLVVALADQKTPGESALLCSAANALIVGDALIGKPPGSLAMLPAAKYADVGRARAGLRRLLELEFDALLVGDGASILREGKAAVQRFLSS